MEDDNQAEEQELEDPGKVTGLGGDFEEYFVPEGFGGIRNRKTLAWWRTPFHCCGYRGWWFFRWRSRYSCCCCCCQHGPSETAPPTPEGTCSITLGLVPNAYGPGKSIAIAAVGGGRGFITAPSTTISAGPRPNYRAEFNLIWNASSPNGQVTVDLKLVSGPGATRTLATNRGPNDQFQFSTNYPGTYLFRAEGTDSAGQTCFATHQVTV